MVNLFDSEPDWTMYVPESVKTQRTQMLFAEDSNLPHGFITGPLTYGDTINIQTNLAHQIWESEYQEYYRIQNLALNEDKKGETFVDMWILTEGLNADQEEAFAKV